MLLALPIFRTNYSFTLQARSMEPPGSSLTIACRKALGELLILKKSIKLIRKGRTTSNCKALREAKSIFIILPTLIGPISIISELMNFYLKLPLMALPSKKF